MSIYTESQIDKLFHSNHQRAIRKLAELPVYCGTEPDFGRLTGWVYEQTIQYCIRQELEARRVKADIKEHVSLRGRVKADLKVNGVAIEVKHNGLFGPGDAAKYQDYKKAASAKGWAYLFITGGESHRPYRTGITKALGRKNVFFLDTNGDWKRFVRRREELAGSPNITGLGYKQPTTTRKSRFSLSKAC